MSRCNVKWCQYTALHNSVLIKRVTIACQTFPPCSGSIEIFVGNDGQSTFLNLEDPAANFDVPKIQYQTEVNKFIIGSQSYL